MFSKCLSFFSCYSSSNQNGSDYESLPKENQNNTSQPPIKVKIRVPSARSAIQNASTKLLQNDLVYTISDLKMIKNSLGPDPDNNRDINVGVVKLKKNQFVIKYPSYSNDKKEYRYRKSWVNHERAILRNLASGSGNSVLANEFIMPFYEVECSIPVIVMPYDSDLITLGQYCDKNQDRPDFLRMLCQVVKQINSAIEYIATKNIIHMDIKGPNVLVKSVLNSNSIALRVIDFGLAVECKENFVVVLYSGTIIPPELEKSDDLEHQKPRKAVKYATDLWCLAAYVVQVMGLYYASKGAAFDSVEKLQNSRGSRGIYGAGGCDYVNSMFAVLNGNDQVNKGFIRFLHDALVDEPEKRRFSLPSSFMPT